MRPKDDFDFAWWHDYAAKGQVRFLRGRLRFEGGKHSAPFPSAVVVFHPPNAETHPRDFRVGVEFLVGHFFTFFKFWR